MIGYGAVAFALMVTLAAAALAGAALAGRKAARARLENNARLCYQAAAGLIGIAACYLLYIIFADRFEYAYVFGYSSRDLPLAYKFSVFWAGQEGSFLLWLVFHAVFGLVLIWRKPAAPAAVLAVYSLLQAMLLVILLVKSPFMLLAEPRGDGVGLNPLLQDPWMVIHPPVLFLGYAALAVPFAYAVGSMLTNAHQHWLGPALPWTLFAAANLGAGMFIGGFWAYKVLGWGGYWAWDPVENSSLVPWLAAGAAVHLLALARMRTAAVKAAYAGVLASFLLVLYGTFLTRSGVLSDFSTHSFADEGVGALLGMVVLVTTLLAFGLFIVKMPGMPAGELYQRLASREFILALTALLLACLGALVFVGMSTPLVTMAFGSPKSVGSNFYNTAALPLAIAVAAALTAGFLLRREKSGRMLQYWWLGLFLAAGIGLAGWLGLHRLPVTIIVCLACTAAAACAYAAYSRTLPAAAVCCHMGVAILLVGVMASSAAGQTVSVRLSQGAEQMIGGQAISYAGTRPAADGTGFYHVFHAGPDQREVRALTKLNKQEVPAAHEPAIYRTLLADIYIAPVQQEENSAGRELTLVKGQPLTYEGVSMTFTRFTMAGMDGPGEIRVQALITVASGGNSGEVRPELVNSNGRITGSTVTALDRYQLHITGLKPGEGKVTIEFIDMAAAHNQDQAELTAEVSTKPLINLVWLGAVLITAGTGWAAWNRRPRYTQLLPRGQGPAAGT